MLVWELAVPSLAGMSTLRSRLSPRVVSSFERWCLAFLTCLWLWIDPKRHAVLPSDFVVHRVAPNRVTSIRVAAIVGVQSCTSISILSPFMRMRSLHMPWLTLPATGCSSLLSSVVPSTARQSLVGLAYQCENQKFNNCIHKLNL